MARRKRVLKPGDVYLYKGRPLVREEAGNFDPKNWQAALSVAPTLSKFFTCTYGSQRQIRAMAKSYSAKRRRAHDIIVVSRIKGADPGENYALCRRIR